LALETSDLPALERRALARRHAECLANAGRLAEAIEVITEATGSAEGAERRDLKRLEIECRLRRGDFESGLAEARDLLAEVGVRIPAGTAGIMAATAAHKVRLGLRGPGFTRRAAAELPAETLERIDVLWALTLGLLYVSPPMSWLVQMHHLGAALAAG